MMTPGLGEHHERADKEVVRDGWQLYAKYANSKAKFIEEYRTPHTELVGLAYSTQCDPPPKSARAIVPCRVALVTG